MHQDSLSVAAHKLMRAVHMHGQASAVTMSNESGSTRQACGKLAEKLIALGIFRCVVVPSDGGPKATRREYTLTRDGVALVNRREITIIEDTGHMRPINTDAVVSQALKTQPNSVFALGK